MLLRNSLLALVATATVIGVSLVDNGFRSDEAAQARPQVMVGETAMLALWTAAAAGAAGPPTGDRVRIIRALKSVGLEEDDAALLPLMMCLARLSARQHVQEML